MPSLPAFVSHCLELLAPLGAVRARRMFGGYGLYVGEVFVALIADERLYMKADGVSQPAFERAGCEPFAYSRRDRSAVTLGYWTAPEQALDSPRAMEPWARLAMAAALRAKAVKPASRAPRGAAAARNAAPDQRRPAATKASKARVAKGRG
ncbi:MAG TPA: TfoX/Sxy family protein [Burkholderiaceae bacterium]|nr:TfoX/Sxy family protein [Burkholderiaceae bacterium]